MSRPVLLLTPSRGLGGGIERYSATLEWSFAARNVEYWRADLDGPGPAAHLRLLKRARRLLGHGDRPARLVLAHRALLPIASLLAREARTEGVSVICHGAEVWGDTSRPRWQMERCLMRHPGVRAVAVSSYTAGTLARVRPAAVLPPGLSLDWRETLLKAAGASAPSRPGINLVTAFRLSDWRDKGLPELLTAVKTIRRPDITVTVCGTGVTAPGLTQLVRRYPWCRVRAGLSDWELARAFADADLVVLATRTRLGRRPCGEGFGMVLLEAQVAGTPVVGPAFGGSHDAFIDQVTGAAPTGESARELAAVLSELLASPARLAQMGRQARAWAREFSDPRRYAELAVERLL